MVCKVDVYFLCDNTNSMGLDIDAVKLAANTIMNDIEALPNIDVAYGVGRYRDFTFVNFGGPTFVPYPTIEYGGNPAGFSSTVASTILAGATGTIPFAPGPVLRRGTWSGSIVAATEGSPITTITYGSGWLGSPLRTAYAEIRGRCVGSHPTGTVTARMRLTSSASPDPVAVFPFEILAGTDDEFSVCIWPTLGSSEATIHMADIPVSGTVRVELINNLTVPVEILWKSRFTAASTAGGDPFCFQHQLSPSKSRTNVLFYLDLWIQGGGGDPAEGWYYAVEKLANDPNGDIGWRSDARKKVVVHLGDNAAHEPVCPAISGEAFTIDSARLLGEVLTANISWCGISIYDLASPERRWGLDSQEGSSFGDTNYDSICGGTQLFGPNQCSNLAAVRGGVVIPVNAATGDIFTLEPQAIVDVVTTATLRCREPRLVQVTLIGAT